MAAVVIGCVGFGRLSKSFLDIEGSGEKVTSTSVTPSEDCSADTTSTAFGDDTAEATEIEGCAEEEGFGVGELTFEVAIDEVVIVKCIKEGAGSGGG